MRAVLACLSAMALLLVAAAFAPEPSCRVTLLLTDASSGKPVAGVVRFTHAADGKSVVLTPKGIDSRGWGLLQKQPGIEEWFVVPQSVTVDLPRGTVNIEAISGLETETANVELDLSNGQPREVTIPLKRFIRPKDRGWRSADRKSVV